MSTPQLNAYRFPGEIESLLKNCNPEDWLNTIQIEDKKKDAHGEIIALFLESIVVNESIQRLDTLLIERTIENLTQKYSKKELSLTAENTFRSAESFYHNQLQKSRAANLERLSQDELFVISKELTKEELFPLMQVSQSMAKLREKFLLSRSDFAAAIIQKYAPNLEKNIPKKLLDDLLKTGYSVRKLAVDLKDKVDLKVEDVAFLVKLYPNLERIELPSIAANRSFLEALSQLKHLKHVGIHPFKGNTAAEALTFLPKTVESLDLTGPISTEADEEKIDEKKLTEALQGFPHLQELNLSRHTHFTGTCLEAIPSDIKKLDLSYCENLRNDKFDEMCKKCKQLIEVSLISNEELTTLDNLSPTIENLLIQQCTNITDASFTKMLKNCQKLTYLSLVGNSSITDVSDLSPTVEKIHIILCEHITNASFIKMLKNCQKLTDFRLSICHQITDVSDLSPTVEKLQIGYTSITDASFTKMLKNCQNLVECTVINIPLITDVSDLSPTVEKLDIRFGINISDASFTKMLKNCQNLIECTLIDIPLITDVSDLSPTVEKLDISDCRNITNASFTKMLKNCQKLTSLDLGVCHQITDVSDLSSKIEKLSIYKCDNISWSSFIEMLKNCRNLSSFNLSNCPKIG